MGPSKIPFRSPHTPMSKTSSTAAAAGIAFAVLPLLAAAQTSLRTVPVYDSTQIALAGYSVIKRVGVDDWSSSFRIRGHQDLASAQQAVIGEAARVGADGVVNLTCFDQTD